MSAFIAATACAAVGLLVVFCLNAAWWASGGVVAIETWRDMAAAGGGLVPFIAVCALALWAEIE
jgi:hypothetical protein